MRSPVTNGKRFRFQFHSQSGFLQSPDSSKQWKAGRPKSHQALQSADVLYREVRFRKKNGPLEHGSSLGQVHGHDDHSGAKLQIF